jgi:hypothetical protein
MNSPCEAQSLAMAFHRRKTQKNFIPVSVSNILSRRSGGWCMAIKVCAHDERELGLV